MTSITKRQKEIYNYIENYIKKNGYAPSLFEIRDKANITTISTAHGYISRLVKAGLLKRTKGIARSIELVSKKTVDFMAIPIIGTIAAGRPIEAIEVPDDVVEIAKDRRFQNGELYALRVKGNSMIGDGIFNGDIAIIKKQEWADNGDTAVAIIDDNEATLKKFYKEKSHIRLQPANPVFEPIFRKNVEIRGIVVKILRNYK